MAPFKVAIVGGGISGLSLALHLDKLGHDFVLLERNDDIAPQVGASIGLFPNGLKILNQLGGYEDFCDVSVKITSMTVRNPANQVMYSHRILEGVEEKSGGYSVRFSERQKLLKILCNRLNEGAKQKVLTGQKVVKVEEFKEGDGERKEGVRVHVADGQVFEADIVVGCDGVHSFTRSEMWRSAKEAGSDAFANDMGDEVPSEYGCVFGLASPSGTLAEGDDWLVHKKDVVVGVVGGPGRNLYWFLFFKLAKTHYGLDFPRFTKEDEIKMCEREAGCQLDDNTTFGDVYKNTTISVPTALPHHCFKRWHYGRIMVIGDSAAKMNPIAGQGGCNCLESCAALVDNIHHSLAANDGSLTAQMIDDVFAKTNAQRVGRVRSTVESGQEVQRVSAWSNWKNQIIDTYLAPLAPTWVFVQQVMASCKGAYVSDTLKDGGIVVGSEEDKAQMAAEAEAAVAAAQAGETKEATVDGKFAARMSKRMSFFGPRVAQPVA